MTLYIAKINGTNSIFWSPCDAFDAVADAGGDIFDIRPFTVDAKEGIVVGFNGRALSA
jgi:hypothetical protein